MDGIVDASADRHSRQDDGDHIKGDVQQVHEDVVGHDSTEDRDDRVESQGEGLESDEYRQEDEGVADPRGALLVGHQGIAEVKADMRLTANRDGRARRQERQKGEDRLLDALCTADGGEVLLIGIIVLEVDGQSRAIGVDDIPDRLLALPADQQDHPAEEVQ